MRVAMGSPGNIFSLVVGINLIVVGAVAFLSGIVSLARNDGSVKKMTSVAYIVSGSVAVYVGFGLARGSFM